MRRIVSAYGAAVVLVAVTIIAGQWEVGYGEALGMHGNTRLLIPVATDGYLWTAFTVRRDVLVALLVELVSSCMGALRTTVTVPPPLLAVSTACLMVAVLWRAHAMVEATWDARQDDQADRPEPVDRYATGHDRLPEDLERPVTTGDRDRSRPDGPARHRGPDAGDGGGGEPTGRQQWTEARLAWHEAARLGRVLTREQLRELMPAATPDAVRALHRRLSKETAAA